MNVRSVILVSSTVMLSLGYAMSSEAQEPRVVGRKGAIAISLDGSVSARQQTVQTPIVNSRGIPTGGVESSKEWSGDYQTFVDVGRFLTDHFVLDVGTFIGGSIGGDKNVNTGIQGGARFYITPSAPASVYVSGGGGVLSMYAADMDSISAANVYGAGGLEAAVRHNASIFVEGQFERDFFDGGAENSLRFKVGLRILF